jgi:hypothetical protein
MTNDVFKFRAECMRDVGEVLLRVHASEVRIEAIAHDLPDVVATLTAPRITGKPLDLASFKAVLAEIADGRFMVETVALAEEYTGERVDELAAAEATERAAEGLEDA